MIHGTSSFNSVLFLNYWGFNYIVLQAIMYMLNILLTQFNISELVENFDFIKAVDDLNTTHVKGIFFKFYNKLQWYSTNFYCTCFFSSRKI